MQILVLLGSSKPPKHLCTINTTVNLSRGSQAFLKVGVAARPQIELHFPQMLVSKLAVSSVWGTNVKTAWLLGRLPEKLPICPNTAARRRE